MSTSYYRYWLPVSIAFHLVLIYIFRIIPVEIQQQENVLNVISVSWEINDDVKIIQPQKLEVKPEIKPVVIPPIKKQEIVNTNIKKKNTKNNIGKYWGNNTKKDIGKGPLENSNKIVKQNAGSVNKGKIPDVIKSSNSKILVPDAIDNKGNGSNRYGNNSSDSIGGSVSAAKSGNSGFFYTSFSKNEEDFTVRYQLTIKNGVISSVKQISNKRDDGKDDLIRQKILSGVVPVDPHCEYDKMTINISVSDGNRCHYIWE